MAKYRDKDCIVCSESFGPLSPKQKTCLSKKCKSEVRRIAERKRYKKKQVEYQRKCKSCGKEFSSTDSRKVYCGVGECEEKRKYIKNKKADEKRKGTRSEEKKEYYLDNRVWPYI